MSVGSLKQKIFYGRKTTFNGTISWYSRIKNPGGQPEKKASDDEAKKASNASRIPILKA